MNLCVHLSLIAVAVSYAAASTCPWYATRYPGAEDVCYVAYDSMRNWTHAEEVCQRDGGHLASVHDPVVNAYLQKSGNLYPIYWLGGQKTNGTWGWTDGSPWNYTHWARGQPAGKGECLAMTTSDGRWYSDDCSQPTPFMCKIPDLVTNFTAPPLVPTLPPDHPTSEKCPKDWQYIASTNLCYRVLGDVFNWQAAQKACNDHEAALVSIPNNATNADILSYARSKQYDNTDVAIGLNYVQQPDGKNWQWEWVDGSTATFTNWRSDQPHVLFPQSPFRGAVMSVLDWDRGLWLAIDAVHEGTTALCERRPN